MIVAWCAAPVPRSPSHTGVLEGVSTSRSQTCQICGWPQGPLRETRALKRKDSNSTQEALRGLRLMVTIIDLSDTWVTSIGQEPRTVIQVKSAKVSDFTVWKGYLWALHKCIACMYRPWLSPLNPHIRAGTPKSWKTILDFRYVHTIGYKYLYNEWTTSKLLIWYIKLKLNLLWMRTHWFDDDVSQIIQIVVSLPPSCHDHAMGRPDIVHICY
jgi:hypothetical protein